MRLSFFDIQLLDISQDLKDELTLGFLHGLDLVSYIKAGVNFETLREVRLALSHKIPLALIKSNLDEAVLRSLRRLYASGRDIIGTGLERYFYEGMYHLQLDSAVLDLLVSYSLKDVNYSHLDFTLTPYEFVDLFLTYTQQGIDVRKYMGLVTMLDKVVAYPYIELLLELEQSSIDTSPFLDGRWSIEQIKAIISGSFVVDSTVMVNSYVNEYFTPGQIELVVRSINLGCSHVICSLDDDKYPIFNEYQMYNIIEGCRFGIDYESYAKPEYSDYDMFIKRSRMLDIKDRETGGDVSSKLRVLKPVSIRRSDLGV